MVDKWRETTLGEIAEIFDGPHATPEKTDDGPIFLGISNISKGRLDLSNTEHLSENDFHRWTRRIEPEEGDVVFSYETRLGEAARIPHDLRCCLGRRMGLLRSRNGLVDPLFLLYAYLGPDFQDTLHSRTVHGSTVDRIPLINMPYFPIVIPGNIQEQRRIAHILGTLDDKIENNRKTAKTLEAMAQAIFQSWFVDFDPVRAKMAGESKESICKRLKLTPEILDLFPDRLVDSELGEIPEGWEVKPLGDLFELAYGKPLKAENRTNGNVPVYGSNGLIGWHDEKLIDGPGIVVGRKGNPGTVTWVESSFYPIDTTFYVISINRVGLRFLYHALMCHDLTSLGADSAVPGLNRNLAYISKQLVPHDSLDSVFENLTEKLFLSSHNLNKQSMDGTEIRDILLPKLISGEIRVPEAEHLIKNIEG